MEREGRRPAPPCSPLSRRRRALGPWAQAFAPGDPGSQRGRCSTARVSQTQPGESGRGPDEGAMGQQRCPPLSLLAAHRPRRRAEALTRSCPQTALQAARAATRKDLRGRQGLVMTFSREGKLRVLSNLEHWLWAQTERPGFASSPVTRLAWSGSTDALGLSVPVYNRAARSHTFKNAAKCGDRRLCRPRDPLILAKKVKRSLPFPLEV